MAFPLGSVLAAAPGILTAAAELIRVIRERKNKPEAEANRLQELEDLLERQAMLVEELALNNRNLVLAVRNNRIISAVSIGIGLTACALVLWR